MPDCVELINRTVPNMKRILIAIAMLYCAVSCAQVIPGYTPINSGYEWLRGKFKALHLPAGSGFPTLATGQWPGSGGVYLDSTNNKFYYYRQGAWKWLMDSANIVSLIAAGGTTDSTLQAITSNVGGNTTTNNVTIGKQDSIGTIFSYPWSTNPLNTAVVSDNTATASVTTDGTGTTISGGGLDGNNYLNFGGIRMGVEDWTITTSVIAQLKNSTSYGLGIVLVNFVGAGFAGNFRLSDTGWVSYNTAATVPLLSDDNSIASTNFRWSAGDTLDLKLIRRHRTYIICMTNRSTGLKAEIYRENVVFSSVTVPRINFYGGTWKMIGNFIIKYDEPYRPDIAGIGDSIFFGSNATTEQTSWWNQVTSGMTAVSLSGPSESSLHGTYKMDDILTRVKPRTLVVAYGVNDLNLGTISLDTFSKRMQRIVGPARDSGMNVIVVNLVPQATSGVTFNDTLSAIATRYGCYYADIFSQLKYTAGTTISAEYYSDGIHPSQNGHNVIASVVSKYVKQTTSKFFPIFTPRLPVVSKYGKIIVLDNEGRIASAFTGTDNNYIRNTPPSGTNRQAADISINGNAWLGYQFRVAGNGAVQSSPDFSVNTNGDSYTLAALMRSKNFSTLAGGYSQFDGTASGADPRVFFINGAYINSYQQALRLNTAFPNTATLGVKITNGTENSVPAGYKPLSITVNTGSGDVEQAYVDKDGTGSFNGIRLPGSTSGAINFAAPATVTSYTFIPPPAASASNGYALTGNTDGTTAWTALSGTGTVTSVASGFGTNFSTITSTGTVVVDTTSIGVTSWVRSKKIIDSLGALITTGAVALNSITASTGTNSIFNTHKQRWTWGNGIAGDTAFSINHITTDAASNAQVGLAVTVKGANSTSSQRTIGGYFENSHTGTGAVNYALWANAPNYSNNIRAIRAEGGIDIVGNTTGSPHIQLKNSAGTTEWINGSFALTGSGNGDWALVRGDQATAPMIADYQSSNIGIYGPGASFTPTAKLHIGAGTTAAGTAPLKFTSGPLLTTAEAGGVEFLTDKYYGTITTGTARKEFTLNDAALTSGTVPVATTNGRLTDGLIIASGTYTPTLTNGTNVASSTSAVCHYIRVGNQVHVMGQVSIDPTASATNTAFEISLPIASDLAATADLSGMGTESLQATVTATVIAQTTNNTASVTFTAGSTVADGMSFSFTYTIL